MSDAGASTGRAPAPDAAPGGLPHHVHCVGVNGGGLLPLACLLAARGHRVTGSDATPLKPELARRGVTSEPGAAARAGLLVRSAAVPLDDPDVRAARDAGVPVLKYSEALGRLMRDRRGLAVGGTHGKTTVTAMLAHLLSAAGRDPSWIVGGRPVGFAPFAAGASDLVCVEACEYDRSFLNLDYEVAIVTGIAPDHLDCFGDAAGVEDAFRRFAAGVRPGGTLVLGPDVPAGWAPPPGPAVLRVDDELPLVALDDTPDGFRGVLGPATGERPFALPVLGRHNVDHLRTAIAASVAAGASLDALVAAAAGFRGVERRLEDLGERAFAGRDGAGRGVRLVDDFAHHPDALRAAAAALRARHPGRRLVAVFQPHQVSRTEDFLEAFAAALEGFDLVALCDIFVARDTHPERAPVVRDTLAARSRADVRTVGPAPLADDAVAGLSRPGDVCVVMGAGDIDGLARRLAGRAAGP